MELSRATVFCVLFLTVSVFLTVTVTVFLGFIFLCRVYFYVILSLLLALNVPITSNYFFFTIFLLNFAVLAVCV